MEGVDFLQSLGLPSVTVLLAVAWFMLWRSYQQLQARYVDFLERQILERQAFFEGRPTIDSQLLDAAPFQRVDVDVAGAGVVDGPGYVNGD